VSYETAPPAGTVYSTPHLDVYATDETPREQAQVPAPPVVELPAPPQPARSRHPAVMPLFVLTVIALLLTSGTLVALVVHSGALKGPRVENAAREPTKAPPSPSANPSSAAPVLEGCLVGTWKTVSVEVLTFDQDQEPVTLTSDGGSTLRLSADGTATEDLAGIKYQLKGSKRTVVGSGTITYTVRPSGTTLMFSDVKANAAWTYYENGKSTGTVPVPSKPAVFEFACGDNTLQLSDEVAQYEYHRS
jgi:hypothetical protein